MTSLTAIGQVGAVIGAALAGLADWRSGHIPNSLTYPLTAAGVSLAILADGVDGLLDCALAVGACCLVPYVLYRQGAIGGGDVKLFASIGALAGLDLGVEAQFLSFVIASLYALARLAWHGKLLRTMANVLFLVVNPVLPRRHRREIGIELMTPMRLGLSVAVGTALVALARRSTIGP